MGLKRSLKDYIYAAIGGIIGYILSSYIVIHPLELIDDDVLILLNLCFIQLVFMVIHFVFLLKVIKNIKSTKSFLFNVCMILFWVTFFRYLLQEASPVYDPVAVLELRILVFILFIPSLAGMFILIYVAYYTRKDVSSKSFLTALIIFYLITGFVLIRMFRIGYRREKIIGDTIQVVWNLPSHLGWIYAPVFTSIIYVTLIPISVWLGNKIGIKIQEHLSLWYITRRRSNLIKQYLKGIWDGKEVLLKESLNAEEVKLREKFRNLGIEWAPIKEVVDETIKMYLESVKIHAQEGVIKIRDLCERFKITEQQAKNLLSYAVKSKLINGYWTLNGTEFISRDALRERLRKILHQV